jgi:hypothetical protein
LTALNGLTSQVQYLTVGTSGTDFAISSASDTHTFNLPTASATNRGALSSADWTTFNNKTSNLGTVTSVGLSSATSGVTIGSTPITTSGTITLAIATASGSQNGLLSSTDWTTFNGKQNALTNPVTGTGTSGQVAYFTGTSAISSESTLFWNSTNDRLGIGLNNPDSILHIFGSGSGNSLTFTKYTCGDGGDIRVGKESGVNNDAIFGTWSNNAVIFYANSAEAMRMFSGRNLHIGPTPASDNGARLQVNGTAAISGSVSTNGATAFANYGLTTKGLYGLYVQRNSTNDSGVEIYHDGTNALITSTYQSTGSFGGMLFLTSATTRLTIASTGAATFTGNINQNINDGALNFYKSDGTTLKAFLGNLNGTTTDEGYLGLYKTNVQKVAIRASGTSYLDGGNVLVGTTTDQGQRLLVQGTGGTTGFTRFTDGATAAMFIGVNSGTPFIHSNNSTLSFGATNANTFSPTMTLSGGNVGIGNTSPDIFGFGSAGKYLTLQSNSGGFSLIQVISDGTSGSGINFGNATIRRASIDALNGSHLEFYTNGTNSGTSVSPRMHITSGGNVLIGTTTDNGYKLRVNGDIWVDGVYRVPASSYYICGNQGYRFNNSTDAFNNFIALDNGNATLRGTLTQNASDERLKNNIEIIPNAIDKIKQLRGVTFKWNQELYETSRTFDIGVIAQEVEQVLPNAVCLAPFDTNFDDNTSKSGQNYLTVYYEKLIPLLIEGIKELKQEIDTLKN